MSAEEDNNDGVCNVCGDGGILVCCDNCPHAYHRSCIGMDSDCSDDDDDDEWSCKVW